MSPAERQPRLPLAVYLHIPFCVRKCPYCDFVTGPAAQAERIDYIEALLEEIRQSPSAGNRVRSVYMGGGTPSELHPEETERVMQAVCASFELSPDAECTVECNPGTVDFEKLQKLRRSGFNRISLGVQSFHDKYLTFLGRIHDSKSAREAFALMREAGFDNISVDLMFGVPGQTFEEWRSDMEAALSLRPEHMSLYCLTVEPKTEFGRQKETGQLQELDDETTARMFELTMDLAPAAGYFQYEISNYALPGRESRHNLVYWRNEEYLGFGVAAASYLDGLRWTNTTSRRDYAVSAPAGRVPRSTEERLEARKALGEEIMLRLRLCEGFSLSELGTKWGFDLDDIYREPLAFLMSDGMIERDGDRVRLTRAGKLVANSVCAQFL